MGDRNTSQGETCNHAPLREITSIKNPLRANEEGNSTPNQQQETTVTPKVKRNNNKPQDEKQLDDTNVVSMPELPPRKYNIPRIDEFLDVVFGAAEAEGEEILTWKVKPAHGPGFPMSDTALMSKLEKLPAPAPSISVRRHADALRTGSFVTANRCSPDWPCSCWTT